MSCPDTNEIELLNNPYLFENGISINLVINFCDVAATALNRTAADCLTGPDMRNDTWEYLKNVRV